MKDAFKGLSVIKQESPDDSKAEQYQTAYTNWKKILQQHL
jgi:hypothetical protein